MKRFVLLLAMTLALAAAQPCAASHTVTDETGRKVVLPDHPHRIACLVPSITDAVFALGAGDDVVAISDYTQYPEEAKHKPSVGSISNPSMEKILSFHPDLVLAQPHQSSPEFMGQAERLGLPIFIVDPHGVAGLLHTVGTLGQAIGREPQAAALVARLNSRIDAVRARVRGQPVINVFVPISYDPVITIGKGAFIAELIEIAGGHSITSDLTQEWPHISMEVVIARQPGALLMLRGGKVTLDTLRTRPGWDTLPAVRTGRVYFLDPRMSFSSPVAIDALEDLAKQFHP